MFRSKFILAFLFFLALVPSAYAQTTARKPDRIVPPPRGAYHPPRPVYIERPVHIETPVYVETPIHINENNSEKEVYASFSSTTSEEETPFKSRRFYVGLRGGFSWMENTSNLADYHGSIRTNYDFEDRTRFAEAAVGFYFLPNFRVEGAYTDFSQFKDRQDEYHIQRDFGSGIYEDADYINRVNTSMWMVNVFYDLDRNDKFRTYAGIGAGQAKVEEERIVKSIVSANADHEGTNTDYHLALQMQLGFIAPVTDRLSLDFNLRAYYVDTERGLSGTAASLGVMFSF